MEVDDQPDNCDIEKSASTDGLSDAAVRKRPKKQTSPIWTYFEKCEDEPSYMRDSLHKDAINHGNLHCGFIIVPPASNYIHPSTVCIINTFIAVPWTFKYIHSRFVYKSKPRT